MNSKGIIIGISLVVVIVTAFVAYKFLGTDKENNKKTETNTTMTGATSLLNTTGGASLVQLLGGFI